jgi:hypothetical protein
MNYIKLENRKNLMFLLGLLLLPVLLYTHRINDSGTVSIYSFLAFLGLITAVRFYFLHLQELRRGIYTMNGVHVNLTNITHYNVQEGAVVFHTEGSELNFKIMSEVGLDERELKVITDHILKDIDVAYKYLKR